MGLRGPKPLKAAVLKARGSKLALVRSREEQRANPPAARPMAPAPPAPDFLTGEARELWAKLTTMYVFSGWELELLEMLCGARQRIAEARVMLAAEGIMLRGSRGRMRVHPALAIERQNVESFAKLTRALKLEN